METKFKKQIERYYNSIIEDWRSTNKIQDRYNGFDFSNEGKIRRNIFFNAGIGVSYDIIKKIKLEKYLGSEYTDKLFSLFLMRDDHDLFVYLFKESIFDNPAPEVRTLSELKKYIDDLHHIFQFQDNSIYLRIFFDKEISKHNSQEKLFEQIDNVIGKDNCIYDYYEFGRNGFVLYWFVSKTGYLDTLNKISNWASENNYKNLMYFDQVDDEGNVEFSFGNPKVRSNYL